MYNLRKICDLYKLRWTKSIQHFQNSLIDQSCHLQPPWHVAMCSDHLGTSISSVKMAISRTSSLSKSSFRTTLAHRLRYDSVTSAPHATYGRKGLRQGKQSNNVRFVYSYTKNEEEFSPRAPVTAPCQRRADEIKPTSVRNVCLYTNTAIHRVKPLTA